MHQQSHRLALVIVLDREPNSRTCDLTHNRITCLTPNLTLSLLSQPANGHKTARERLGFLEDVWLSCIDQKHRTATYAAAVPHCP